MRINGKKLLNDILAGRSIVGYHISFEDGQLLEQDDKYKLLTQSQKKLLQNLIDPKF